MEWSKKFQKGSEMWSMFVEYWGLVQKYWNVEDVDRYWDCLIDDCGKFLHKYPTSFSSGLIGAFIDEQERKRKGAPGYKSEKGEDI